jgi:hypothetical protein
MRFTKTPIAKIATSAGVAAVLGLTGVSVAGAASTSTSTPKAPTAASAPAAKAHPKAAKALRRHIRRHAGVLAAKTIGIKPTELRQELLAGKTIAAIATEHGVTPQKVIDTLTTAADAKIAAAVTAQKITPERAAELKSRIDAAIPKIVNDWHPKAESH